MMSDLASLIDAHPFISAAHALIAVMGLWLQLRVTLNKHIIPLTS
jgi:hypothetical protein